MALRAPRAKPGQLKAVWGKLPGQPEDLCYAAGEGVPRCDAHLLHNALSSPRCSPLTKDCAPSLLDELQARGYDISTLRISVEKHGDTQ